MKYELELFDRIISGELYPFNNSNNQINYHKAIAEKHDSCFNLTIATVKQLKNKIVLVNKQTMCAFHPLAIKTVIPQPNLFHHSDVESIPREIYKLLKIKEEDVVLSLYYKQSGKTYICIKEKCDCYSLPQNEAKYYYYNELLKEEVKQIKQKIKDVVFKYTTSKDIEHYIHKQQHSIVNLCYQLIKLINPKQRDDIYKAATKFTNTDVLNLTYIFLEGLLRFIEKDYLEFVDVNIQVPCRSVLLKTFNFKPKLEFVKATLLNSNINPQLIKIIYVPFLKLSAITLEEKITYKQIIFFNAYLSRFYEYFEKNETIDDKTTFEILIDLNYNCIECVNYKIELIQTTALQTETITDKIDYLYQCLKTINQQQQSTQLYYNSLLPSLKNQITTWLEEEINYHNKKMTLTKEPPDLFSVQPEKPKIQSGLSVAQLAYFHKLQHDVGMITNRNQRDISRVIAATYQTSKVHEISPESITSKYYNVEETTLQAVKDMLIKMLNEINKN